MPRLPCRGKYRSWAAVLRSGCKLRLELGTILSSCALGNTNRTDRRLGDSGKDQNVSNCSNARWWLTCAVVGLLCWPKVGAATDECNAARTAQPDQNGETRWNATPFPPRRISPVGENQISYPSAEIGRWQRGVGSVYGTCFLRQKE